MSRRGFTILELSLAAALGALVLLAALGVFSSMDRGDRVLAARAKENAGLEVASIAIENAIGTLVMESGGQTGTGSKTGTKAGEPADPKAAAPSDRVASPPAPGRPRFLLESDSTPGLPGMPDVAAPHAGTAGSGELMSGVLTAPQRLELVLARHPIAVDLPRATVLTVADTGDNGSDGGAGEASDANPKAVRGAFTLRPEARKAGQADGPTTWTLWWIPIQRRGGAGAEAYVGEDDLAVPLATGLLSARWSVFYEEAWSNEHSTGVVLELPAYVKLQVTTSAGLQADWLFEVGWTMGPEFRPPAPQPGEEEESTESGTEGVSTSGTAAGAATSTKQLTPTRVGPGGAAGSPARTAKPAPPVRAPGTSTTPPKGPSGRPPAKPTGAPR